VVREALAQREPSVVHRDDERAGLAGVDDHEAHADAQAAAKQRESRLEEQFAKLQEREKSTLAALEESKKELQQLAAEKAAIEERLQREIDGLKSEMATLQNGFSERENALNEQLQTLREETETATLQLQSTKDELEHERRRMEGLQQQNAGLQQQLEVEQERAAKELQEAEKLACELCVMHVLLPGTAPSFTGHPKTLRFLGPLKCIQVKNTAATFNARMNQGTTSQPTNQINQCRNMSVNGVQVKNTACSLI